MNLPAMISEVLDAIFGIRPPKDAPPCSKWKVWIGPEIEGAYDRNEMTLFIRSLPRGVTLGSLKLEYPDIRRVWFCKEFRNATVLQYATSFFDKVCIEVMPDEEFALSIIDRQRVRLYFKFHPKTAPRVGDQICVGKPYTEEYTTHGFALHKADKAQYNTDTRIY